METMVIETIVAYFKAALRQWLEESHKKKSG